MSKALPMAAIALSVISLAVSLTRGPEQAGEPTAPQPVVENADKPEPDAQEAQLVSVEMELTRLMRRVEALERAGVARPGEPAAAMTTEAQAKQLQALRGDVDALLTGEPTQTEEGRKRLKEVVRSIQDEVFADRAQERAAQREQGRAERFKKLIEEARLSSTQAQDLTRLLDDEAAQRRALMEARRSAGGGAAAGRRDQLRTLRQRTDEGAKSLLSEEQYGQYQAMREEERGGSHDRGRNRAAGSERGERGERRGVAGN